jgi:hypothetical protein
MGEMEPVVMNRQKNAYVLLMACCADSKVLTNNIVMVMGPTPPGTGVM